MKTLIFLFLFISSISHAKNQSPVLVAVVDMGIATNSIPYLKKHVIPGWDFGENNSSMGIDYNDIYEKEYHGTLIAGLILRKVDTNKIKIMDIVYNDYKDNKFKLHEYFFAENMLQLYRRKKAYEKFTEHLRDVFNYAKMKNAKVINFSSSDSRFYGSHLQEWIKKNSDTIVVVSAGNDGDNIDKHPQYPCMFENVICVGAVNKNKKTSYSNYGKSVTLYAQGDYSEEVKGTSFSAPIISQAVALIKYKYPSWDYSKVKKELLKYTKKENGIRVFQNHSFHLAYN